MALTQNCLPSFPSSSKHLVISILTLLNLSATPFCCGYPAPSAPDVCPLIYSSSWMLLKCILHHCQFEVLLVPRNEPRILWSTQGCHFCVPQNWPLHIDWNRQWTSVHTVPHVNWAPRMVLECRWRPARPCVCSSSGFALELIVHEAWTSNTLHTLRVGPRWGQSAPSWHHWNLGAPSVCARAVHPLSSSLSVLEPGHWICIEDSRADPEDTSAMLRLGHIEWPVGHSWRWKSTDTHQVHIVAWDEQNVVEFVHLLNAVDISNERLHSALVLHVCQRAIRVDHTLSSVGCLKRREERPVVDHVISATWVHYKRGLQFPARPWGWKRLCTAWALRFLAVPLIVPLLLTSIARNVVNALLRLSFVSSTTLLRIAWIALPQPMHRLLIATLLLLLPHPFRVFEVA